ncbi:OLC1v1031258C1 [Oldenlandia corymbosa var. corymbosa]|uniref:OLC1v1031258C1 n=1 Tax=Oldenlandia corymbosa var. corymbosa TaxID=529605 RepID=A0AAV1CHZ4_OLDCO|nr:OLC1v1031258C1 [Oldenlandia corymbosa var. corymbosa]
MNNETEEFPDRNDQMHECMSKSKDISSYTNVSPVTLGMDKVGSSALAISTTDAIRSFLTALSVNLDLSKDVRDLASSLSQHPSVSYKSLKSIWIQSDRKTRPDLLNLLTRSNFHFTSPVPREKVEETVGSGREERYAELVKDITPKKSMEDPFSSYKDQLGFGLHVVVTMFTGYLVGYAAFRALFSHNVAMSAAGGILGLVVGMLVETLLFIIRFSSLDQQPKSFASKTKKDQ